MNNRNLGRERYALLDEIEKPLRRKFRSEKKIGWLSILLFMLLLTILYVLVARIVNDQARSAQVTKDTVYASLCSQYKADVKLTGTAAEETLNKICL